MAQHRESAVGGIIVDQHDAHRAVALPGDTGEGGACHLLAIIYGYDYRDARFEDCTGEMGVVGCHSGIRGGQVHFLRRQ